MGLHDSPLFESKRPSLLEKPRWEAHLAHVMDKSGKVSKVLLFLAQLETLSNVSGVHGDSRRVTCGIAIPRVQSGDQRSGERQTCPFQPSIDTAEELGGLSLLTIEPVQAVCRKG